MQGIDKFIPTEEKVRYLNQLLRVGFDTIDFGSFVSPQAIPQMKDTSEVLKRLNLEKKSSKLLAIVANIRGAKDAVEFKEIDYLGYPLSISETFQKRNTNKSIVESLNILEEIQNIAVKNNKTLVVYISMGFGNPYGDPYDVNVVGQFAGILDKLGVEIISLADTIGVSNSENITYLFEMLVRDYPSVEFGAHLHSKPDEAFHKIDSAYKAGCRRFDGAINGYGGCPMAKDELVGNIATEVIVNYMRDKNIHSGLNEEEFNKAVRLAPGIFPD